MLGQCFRIATIKAACLTWTMFFFLFLFFFFFSEVECGVSVGKRLAKNYAVPFPLEDTVTRSYFCLKVGFNCLPGMGPQAMTFYRILVGRSICGWLPLLELFSSDLSLYCYLIITLLFFFFIRDLENIMCSSPACSNLWGRA